MKNKIILLVLAITIAGFFNGCSEKPEVVIKKTEQIPAENLTTETIPGVVLAPQETVQETVKHKETVSETIIATEKPAQEIKQVSPENIFSDTKYECDSPETQKTGTKTQTKDTVLKTPKKTPEIVVSKSPIVVIPGECLIYRIKWNFANVGKFIIACKKEKINNQDVFHIVGLTVPEGLWTKIGNGYNRFDSYIDGKNKLPFYYYSYSASTSTSQITKTIIDHKTKTLSFEVRKYKNNKQYGLKTGKSNFSGILFDGLSAIYAMRGMAGEEMPPSIVPVGITKITNINICFLEKNIDNFSVGKKEYWLLKSESNEDEAIFRKGVLFVSISADNERLPLLLKGKVPFGTGTVELVSRKILDGDFSTDSKTLTEILNSIL